MVSSIRDQNVVTFIAGQDPTIGPPRLDLPPTVAAQGPQIEIVSSSSVRDNPTNISTSDPPAAIPTYVVFPQRGVAQRQSWSVVWQGDLLGPSFTGQFVGFVGGDANAPLATLSDIGVDFCQAGVLAGDFVTVYGCTVDQQCGPLQVCRRSPTAPETAGALPINGLCLPLDPTLQAQRIIDCAGLLETVRRYEITAAKAPAGARTVLSLRPKLDEIVSPASGCYRSGADGGAGADAGADGGTDAGTGPDLKCAPPTDPTRAGFRCVALDDEPTRLRCVQPCKADTDCRAGRRCVAFGGASFCADGPPLTADLVSQCGLDQLVAYKIGVGSDFLVQGTAPTPFVPGQKTAERCTRNPALVNRIPLVYDETGSDTTRSTLPLCTNAAILTGMSSPPIDQQLLQLVSCLGGDPKTTVGCKVLLPAPNPCLLGERTVDPDHPNDPTLGGPITLRTEAPYRALFQNREIGFILTSLEAYFGDTTQITFDVHGGYQAESVIVPTTIDVEMPTRIVVSPLDSQTQAVDQSATHELPFLFVVDQRRLGRASAGVGATRGQILRINPRRVTTTDTTSLLPIYDDLTATGGLWPIQ